MTNYNLLRIVLTGSFSSQKSLTITFKIKKIPIRRCQCSTRKLRCIIHWESIRWYTLKIPDSSRCRSVDRVCEYGWRIRRIWLLSRIFSVLWITVGALVAKFRVVLGRCVLLLTGKVLESVKVRWLRGSGKIWLVLGLRLLGKKGWLWEV